jgi:ADP-ribose pyrophosphatase
MNHGRYIKVFASARATTKGQMYEKTLKKRTVYEGRILDVEVQDVEMADGRPALREIVRHGGAVAVLARRADGQFVLVRQFRKPVEEVMLEVVAGNREAGEEAEACARRELEEETGFRAARIRRLGFIYPSPGYVDEKIEVFYADVEPGKGEHRPDEDEHLEVVFLERDEIIGKMSRDEIHDSKTLAAWLLYEKIVVTEQGGM